MSVKAGKNLKWPIFSYYRKLLFPPVTTERTLTLMRNWVHASSVVIMWEFYRFFHHLSQWKCSHVKLYTVHCRNSNFFTLFAIASMSQPFYSLVKMTSEPYTCKKTKFSLGTIWLTMPCKSISNRF